MALTDPDDTRRFLRILAAARRKGREEAWDQAARLWAEVVDSNPVEATFWASLANARYRAGDHREAIPAFEKAIELGTGDGTERGGWFSPFPFDAAYRVACCYALLNEPARALQWLARAFEMGYRNLAGAQTDEVFSSLQDHPRFREIVGLADPSAMSREEGWRFDLALLSRQIKRKAYEPDRFMTEAELDRTVEEVSKAVPRLTDAQITVEMMKLLCRLGDGHAGIGLEERPDLGRAIPVQLYLFEEGPFIIAAPPRHEDLLGAQVVRFGDQTPEEIIQGLLPILSRDNERWPKTGAPSTMRLLSVVHALGLIPEPNQVSLTVVDRQGQTRRVSLTAEENPRRWSSLLCPDGWVTFPDTLGSPQPLYLKNLAVAHWFEYLPDVKTVYFQFNSVRDEPGEDLRDFTDRLFGFIDQSEVDRLVIDMRWNGGGNTYLEVPLIHRLIGNKKVNRRGALWVIIGRHTFSAAQNGVTLMNRHTEALFAGEPTGSRPNFVGETIPITLPYSKLEANVSDLYWQTSWPMDYRTWIAPLLYTPPTFEAFRQNRDPALEAILTCTEHLPGW